MKIDERFFKFPGHLPNDLEGFIFYYPQKFPPIVPYFEEVAQKIGTNPQGYKDYGYWAQKQMFAGITRIKKDFEKNDQENLEFLVNIDQKLGKLFCYRFWVVNYLFADGPLHEFYVDNLKNLVRKFIDITEDVEDYEQKVIQYQRDLLQTDYADLYLQQALSGVEIIKILSNNPRTKDLIDKALKIIKSDKKDWLEKLWEKIIEVIQDKNDPDYKDLQELFLVPLNQVKMRGNMTPLFAFLTHMIEFKQENEELKIRYEDMKVRIQELIDQAKNRLSVEDFELFKICYNQARNFSMFKDVMGEVDPFLIPFWFGVIHKKIKEILSKTTKCDPAYPTGHGAMFSYIVWFLPKQLKDKVMTPDYEPYEFTENVEEILKRSDMWNAWSHPIDRELI